MTRDVRSALSIALAAILIAASSITALSQTRKPAPKPAPKVVAPATPYDQGYQQGYSEGFKQGTADYGRGTPRNLRDSEAYRQRESMYNATLASNEEYIEGYNLGLELGYMDSYYGRTRNTITPSNGAVIAKATVLANSRRGRMNDDRSGRRDDNRRDDSRRDDSRRDDSRRDDSRRDDSRRNDPPARDLGPVNIPAGTELNLRLASPIDTKNNRVGDRFAAEVITPGPYDGAKVEGHISTLNKSGKVSGRTELALSFDTITLPDGRSANITASLEKIVESETVKEVDAEGNVRSGSRTKDSQVRGGVGAAAGAIIGGIAGGVKGAVLGAVIGGGAGVGTVYLDGSKNLLLEPGTEMVIRTERTQAR
ncbi:MAG TPA: hypothetical protein VJX74_04045 [Blastocatellia bacterium]|nr:hypothetical protein [Blastocatellia bacterium]